MPTHNDTPQNIEIERSNKLEEAIEIAQTRWENCMGEADDNIGEAHRLYVKKGPTKLGSVK